MEKVGVEAVVEGLSAFMSDMGKLNSSLQGVRGEGTLLQKAFGWVGDALTSFGESAIRVAETALGVLLRDAIRAAIDFMKELISVTIDAGNEFQTLEIRLGRLNLNALTESGMDYNEAAQKAVDLTKEQLAWLIKLAAQSPYDSTDVSNTYTLARSYGFAAEQSKNLTEDILDFASGMGLTEQHINRIITNFGQLVQQGKVTGREMTDLARGAFVPVNDILKLMQEQTGLTGTEFDDFKNTGEGVNAFFTAFSTLVEQRFSGATEQMSQTFKSATDNVLDLVKGIFGLNTVKPVLSAIGKKVSEFSNAFTDNPERWDRLVEAATRLGDAISGIFTGIFNLMPSAEGLADQVVGAIENMANWVDAHREDIIGFFVGVKDTIVNDVIPFIRDDLIGTFNKISEWVDTNRPLIDEFFGAIGNIVKEFFSDLFGGGKAQEEGAGFLDIIKQIMQYVIDNQESITKWVEVLWSVFAVWQVIGTALNIAGGIIISIIGFVLGLTTAISGFLAIAEFIAPIFTAAFGALISPIGLVIAAVAGLVYYVSKHFDELKTNAQLLWWGIKYWFEGIANTAQQTLYVIGYYFKQGWEKIRQGAITAWESIVSYFNTKVAQIKAVFQIDWGSIGRNIIDGIASGIRNAASSVVNAARSAAQSAYNATLSFLGIHSPSKLFFEIGANTMEGMASGIQKAAGLAASSMQGAMAQVSSAALPSVTNSTVINNSSSFNLTVNSQSRTEPIVQDFNMMESLAAA